MAKYLHSDLKRSLLPVVTSIIGGNVDDVGYVPKVAGSMANARPCH